jgi:hypothetical protein
MKPKQKEILMKWMEYNHPNEVASFNIICKATPFGWLGTSADRVARKCVKQGLLARQHHRVNGVTYAYFGLVEETG